MEICYYFYFYLNISVSPYFVRNAKRNTYVYLFKKTKIDIQKNNKKIENKCKKM